MATITEDYVSYELSKLLKEKGFNELCFRLIREDGEYIEKPSQAWNGLTKKQKAEFYLCPTYQMAMKWLRKIHKLSIEPYYDIALSWAVDIKYIGKHTNYKEFEEVRSQTYNSYEEVVEAAIKYCLENLI